MSHYHKHNPLVQIVSEPYTHTLGSLPAYCTAEQHIWRAEVPLIYFWIMEGHHLEQVFHQFGMKQPVPLVVNMSTDLHKISLQGKWEKDWEAKHDVYIQQWANWEHEVCAASLLDSDDMYLVECMKWYDRSTRWYITVESAYWELTLSQQFLPLCWHHCSIKYLL